MLSIHYCLLCQLFETITEIIFSPSIGYYRDVIKMTEDGLQSIIYGSFDFIYRSNFSLVITGNVNKESKDVII